MKSRRWLLMMAALVLLAACGTNAQEETFRRRLQEMDALKAQAAPDLQEQITARKADFERAYKALPGGEAKSDPLGKLNQDSYTFLEHTKTRIEHAAALKAEEQKAKQAEAASGQLKSMAGYWRGVGMDLTITEAGSVEYEGLDGGVKKSVTGKIKELGPAGFTVSVLVGTAKFRIDELPHEADGAWKMRVDGIELTRMPAGTKPERKGE